MKNKKKWISLLAVCALSISAIAFGSIQQAYASAEDTTVSEFNLYNGASVRLATEEELENDNAVSGIRFAAYITEPYYQTLTQTTYPTATSITLQSTISKVVEEGAIAPTPFTYSWDIKNSITFDENGVATFYHTLNFNALTGDDLKMANAFEMQADFWLEVTTNATAEATKIQADNAGEVDTTRSMRQVAYMAYTTPGTAETPNDAYQDETLKTYFAIGASNDVVYDMDAASTAISDTAPENVTVDKAYLVDETGITNITEKTLAGDTGVFTEEEASVSTTKNFVYFDADNTAYTTQTRFVTKIIDNESELTEVLKWNATESNSSSKYVLGYNLLNADLTVSKQIVNSKNRYFENGTFDGNGHTLTVSLGVAHYDGLFGRLTNVAVKNVRIDVTRDFSSVTDKPNFTKMRHSILAGTANAASSFSDICLNVERASGDVTYNYTEDGNNYLLYVLIDDNASAKNVVVNVADGLFIPRPESTEAKLTATGFGSASSWYVFANELSAGSKYTLYKSVSDAVSQGEKFKSLRSSGYWTFDEENETLTFGKTNDIYDEGDDVMITQTPILESNDYSANATYAAFEAIANPEYLIPGLAEGFIPQGMDVWEEKGWILISGYFDSANNTSGSPSSMLVAVDTTTGKLVGKYCLKNMDGTYNTSHVGGIAVTEKNVFISNGSKLYRIPLSQLENVGKSGTLKIVEEIGVPVTGAFCNYSNGVLWVGDYQYSTVYVTPEWRHMTNNDGGTYKAWAVGYCLKDTESEFSSENWDSATMEYATPDYVLSITNKIQGITFTDNEIVLSQSYGRKNDSKLLIYDNVLNNAQDCSVELNGKSVPVWFLDSGVSQGSYTMMSQSEGVSYYNGKLLVLYESGSMKYNADAKAPTDYVWSVTLTN